MRALLLLLALAVTAALIASALLRGGVPAAEPPESPRSPATAGGGVPTPEARLAGLDAGAPEADDTKEYRDADLTTTLGALRFQPPNVPAAAVARLRALVRSDPSLLDHLVRVALGLTEFEYGALPPDYPFGPRAAARWAVLALPREATPAVTAMLEEHADDERLGRALLYLLAAFGPEAEGAVPTLVARLEEEGTTVRLGEQVLFVLAAIGPGAGAATPHLLAYARDPEHPLRGRAIHDLYAVAGMSPEVTTLYAGLLESREHDDRVAAFDVVLSQMGADAEGLRPVFVRLLEDDQHDIFMWAAMALGQIEVRAPEVVQRLGRLAEEGDLDTEAAALGAIRTAGSRGQEELLTIAKRAEYLETAVSALYHLGHTGYPVRNHPTLLLGLLRDAESGVRGNVVHLIAHLDPKPRASDFLPFLRTQVRDPESPLRRESLGMAANLEEDGSGGALDLLVEALADDALRPTAAALLGGRSADAARIVPALEPYLDELPVMEALKSLALGDAGARARIRYLVKHGASERIRAFAVSASELLDEVDATGPDDR